MLLLRLIAIAFDVDSQQWDNGKQLEQLTSEAKKHDTVWITLMGNDAQALVIHATGINKHESYRVLKRICTPL